MISCPAVPDIVVRRPVLGPGHGLARFLTLGRQTKALLGLSGGSFALARSGSRSYDSMIAFLVVRL